MHHEPEVRAATDAVENIADGMHDDGIGIHPNDAVIGLQQLSNKHYLAPRRWSAGTEIAVDNNQIESVERGEALEARAGRGEEFLVCARRYRAEHSETL